MHIPNTICAIVSEGENHSVEHGGTEWRTSSTAVPVAALAKPLRRLLLLE